MSGAWAKVCDEFSRDFFSDETPQDHLDLAGVNVALSIRELHTNPGSGRVVRQVVRAGAHLRAYRKSSPDQGERYTRRAVAEVYDGRPAVHLLWSAMVQVGLLGCERGDAAPRKARWAEACLREWYLRQQQEAAA